MRKNVPHYLVHLYMPLLFFSTKNDFLGTSWFPVQETQALDSVYLVQNPGWICYEQSRTLHTEVELPNGVRTA